jgi:transposase
MPLIFEQQPRESNKAFAAFNLYLSLGAERSTREVGEKLGKSEGLIERWAAKFDWRSRVAAHAAHLAVVEREAIEAAARSKAAEWEKREQQLRETEWTMHERAIAAAKRGLDAYMEREKVYANLADIARMLEIASKLGRLATGLGTDGERRKGDDLPAVRVEVTVALEKIYGEPLPGEVVDVEVVGGAAQTQNRVLAAQTGSPGSQTGELPAQTGETKP